MSTPLLSTQALSKHYGPHQAVADLNLELKPGEILGLLGPNGAGKTTSLRMLAGSLAPQSGQVIVNGFDLQAQPSAAKSHIGYLPDTPPLHKELRVTEYLKFCARLHGLKGKQLDQACDEAIQACGLDAVAQQIIGSLSKGYQQRVGLAQAIVHKPKLIILDEPTVGLDPTQLRDIRQLIRDLADERAVIFSSHILSEVQSLCDRVCMLVGGQVVYQGPLTETSQEQDEATITLSLAEAPEAEELSSIEGVQQAEKMAAGDFRLKITDSRNTRLRLSETCVERNWGLLALQVEQRSLEDIFAELSGL